ncbi:PQQ-dependent sugar dehydrogenase [uncultured Cellulomonas sp.]|uniref:PQQ-dependent sugar dehydrogenase n=1 Tax=uncultured Cellulomonas sp. TaxID=189682 RepID=UPI0028E9DA85|nr:PQQ-dependent sugar dehydrogenase [uncultured Cellulomonas sp.]
MSIRTHRPALVILLALLCAGVATTVAPPAAAAVIPGFSDTLVATVASPTAIAFTADGRMLITDKGGRLRVRTAAGTLLTAPALDLSSRLCVSSERGLLGVAVDPDPTTRAIYLFYTARGTSSACPTSTTGTPAGAPTNRVSRFVLGDTNVVDPASETILLDGIYTPAGNHNAGDLHVGKDGYLYVSTGDGGCDYAGNSGCGGANDASRDRNILNGKILRVERTTGAPAAGNPFLGAGTVSCRLAPGPAGSVCRETFAWGLRNPFRFAFDPDAAGTSFRINDVGQNAWEEIDAGVSGADYGWPAREGPCAQTGSSTDCGAPTPAGMTDPVFAYDRSAGCGSITGGAFVPDGLWPASYDAAYVYADYVCGKVMTLSGGTSTDLATGLGGAVHLEFGPSGSTQALYYTTFANGGEIRRITYTGTANRTPVAALTAAPSSGPAPLTTTLNGSGSSDPDGDPLTYLWTFGDGSAGATTSTPTVSHTYAAGTWTASLRVRDPSGSVSAPVTTTISSGNTAPVATIASPAAGATFSVGETFQLSGSATDAQDGTLAPSRLSWTILRVHDQHTHPFLGPVTGTGIDVVAPGPEDLAAAANSFLRVSLTATDSGGVSTTVVRDFQPRKVAVTLTTGPPGRTVVVNGLPVTGPTTVTSWAGFALQLSVPAQTDAAGRPYGFNRWSDGSTAASRTWTTPSTPTTLSAALTLRGLQGAYFDNQDLTGTTVNRLDPTVGFSWGTGAPVAGIGADTFSVRWSGAVIPRYSQTYTFSTTSDDGVRLWVNGTRVIDQWTTHSSRVDTGTIALTAGVPVPIVLEYFDATGSAVAQLRWSSSSQAQEIVPTDRLRPYYAVNMQPSGTPVPPGYAPDTGSVYGKRSSGLSYGWNASNSSAMRDRNSTLSPDQRYDTLAFLQLAPNTNARWELSVPNGTYSVRLVAGDPTSTGSTIRLLAEDVLVVSGTTTTAQRWLDATAEVTVTDRRLTISNGTGAANNKLSFVEVRLL